MQANDPPIPMTSNRPYLLRAIYDWITDNNFTPYILVDAMADGVRVPPQAVKDGKVVLNLDMRAVADLDLGNERVTCKARFSGVGQVLNMPVNAILAIYAQENGQGMMFAEDGDDGAPPPSARQDDGDKAEKSGADGKRGAPHLKVVK